MTSVRLLRLTIKANPEGEKECAPRFKIKTYQEVSDESILRLTSRYLVWMNCQGKVTVLSEGASFKTKEHPTLENWKLLYQGNQLKYVMPKELLKREFKVIMDLEDSG